MQPQDERTSRSRTLIESLDSEFARLHARSRSLIQRIPLDLLYRHLPGLASKSIGEDVLRSAAAVEQTCGGLLSNLWDDPFEWTLPETLSTTERVLGYLDEVENTRQHAFAGFENDAELLKDVSLPSGEFQPVIRVLLETLLRATRYEEHAEVVLRAIGRKQ
jgi:hypothetical protein